MRKAIFAAAVMVCGQFGAASAAILTSDSFDTDPVLAASQTAGAWYVDRYAPAGFSSQSFLGDNRLALEIVEADGQGVRPTQTGLFYSTQGRKFDTAGAQSIEIDLFIDSTWGPGRVGGLWATGVDASNAVSSYPILEYFDGQFQMYDIANGGWIASGTPAGFVADTFATLGMSLQPWYNTIEFYVNDTLIGSQANLGTVAFSDVILQGYNNPAVDRTIYFDNLVVSTDPISAVPLPAGLPLLALAMAGLYGASRRRRS